MPRVAHRSGLHLTKIFKSGPYTVVTCEIKGGYSEYFQAPSLKFPCKLNILHAVKRLLKQLLIALISNKTKYDSSGIILTSTCWSKRALTLLQTHWRHVSVTETYQQYLVITALQTSLEDKIKMKGSPNHAKISCNVFKRNVFDE